MVPRLAVQELRRGVHDRRELVRVRLVVSARELYGGRKHGVGDVGASKLRRALVGDDHGHVHFSRLVEDGDDLRVVPDVIVRLVDEAVDRHPVLACERCALLRRTQQQGDHGAAVEHAALGAEVVHIGRYDDNLG